MRLTNTTDISLPLAVWLAYDEYDFVGGENRISATSLLKPTRQFILNSRIPLVEREFDVQDFIASRLGNAVHDSIERAWTVGYKSALRKLGTAQRAIDAVRINPTEPEEGTIPIYLERRGERTINGWTVSGKFDICIEGRLYDFKTTSVYADILGQKDDDYILQGSIYRWLHQDVITTDEISIEWIFTDWSRSKAKQDPSYPQKRLKSYKLKLLSLEETEQYIIAKTNEIRKFWNSPEEDIPFCNDKELWRSKPQFKYYSDPTKTSGRSTRNFDDPAEANKFRAEKGKGVVITKPGKVKACGYCPAFNYCKQKDLYDHD